MAKQTEGSRGPTSGASALGAALDELTQSVTALNPRIQALAAGFNSPAPTPSPFPFVDLTGTAAPPEELETDQDRARREKEKSEAEAKAESAKYEPMNQTAGRVREMANAFQSIASMGGQPASAVMALGGQVSRLTQNLPTLGKAFGDMIGGQFGASITSLAGKFGPYATAVSQFIQVAASLPQLFKSAADSVRNYVSAFAPVTASRYDRAWADLIASIGENLTPVLDAATEVVRWFGDTIAGITPVIRPVVQYVTTAFQPIGRLIGDVFRQVLTGGVLLAEAFAPLALIVAELSMGPLQMLVAGMQGVLDVVKALTRGVANLMGLGVPEYDGASRGKSAPTATFTTSSSAWQEVVRNSVNQGRATQNDIPNKVSEIATDIRVVKERIVAFLEQAGQIRDQAGNAGRVAAGVATGGLTEVPEILKGLKRLMELRTH